MTKTINNTDPLHCSACDIQFVAPQLPGTTCSRPDCPYADPLSEDGQKLLQVLLDVTARWANNTDVDARVIAFAYGGAAGACILPLPTEDRLRIVHRMCEVLIVTADVPLGLVLTDRGRWDEGKGETKQ